jgi:hypothetical protein
MFTNIEKKMKLCTKLKKTLFYYHYSKTNYSKKAIEE